MSTIVKIIVYLILGFGTIWFGTAFYEAYHALVARSEKLYTKEEFEERPLDTSPVVATGARTAAAPTNTPAAGTEESQPGASIAGGEARPEASSQPAAEPPPAQPVPPPASLPPKNLEDRSPSIALYGAGFALVLVTLGLLAAYDLTQCVGNRTVNALYTDEGGESEQGEYELAEQEWAKGDYLEAIRMLREFLGKNPRAQHAAIRIAEIYEKDLENPLAAALEYEEILGKKLPRERWGWTAIHLSNLYSGPLARPDKALDLLRKLESEYGDTIAAVKARRRLAMIDAYGEPQSETRPPAQDRQNPPAT